MPNLTWSQMERSAYRPPDGWIWKFVGLWALSVIVAVIACAAMCGVL